MRTLDAIRWITYFCLSLGIMLEVRDVDCQIVNKPPHFIPGSGDMARFSLLENTPVGSPVYQLRGSDPEGGKLRFSISGPVFNVDRNTGVVRLQQELDRETQDTVEVIISITDEGMLGTEPNTVSLRREIPVRDYNDNPPTFIGRPYTATVSESTPVGSMIDVRPPITIIDRDKGPNADIELSCYQDGNSENDVCETFLISTDKLGEGNYTASLILQKELDYESKPSYLVTIMARDGSAATSLLAYGTVSVSVKDVQDQPPVFINAPYSTTIPENTREDTSILTITAVDGDTGHPRPILLTIENDDKGHFKLMQFGKPEEGTATLITTNIPLDRESPEIMQNGGVYTFTVRATELINNEVPSDYTTTRVTIVVTDVDDHAPEFNKPSINISIPENLDKGTALPGLTIYAIDKDMGNNSLYELSLRNVRNAEGVFSVTPTKGKERTPVIVKVQDPSKLDFDVEDENLKTLVFDLIASINGREMATSRVTVQLQDTNDNSPQFDKQFYKIQVFENEEPDTQIANITALDRDSGTFGEVTYVLKGFGSDNFYTDRFDGGLYVKNMLDYEKQTSYSLTIVAVDGGDREANANLYVDVIDVNDNYPTFESNEYTRTVREGVTTFEPQFFVRATDIDGPTQGGNNVTYAIMSDNSISGNVFTIDSVTGEIMMRRPAKSMDTERGEYELVVSATDHGHPPLRNTTLVVIRVGISGNQRPVFRGDHRDVGKLPVVGPPSYHVTLPENAKPGDNVTKVSASDPDGEDDLLRYKILETYDNFVIDEITGLIKVSRQAHLDRDTNPDSYEVIVNAVDAGFPIPETATTIVYVTIKDVNDKPPKFSKSSYVAYVSERADINTEVLQVIATDTDMDSKLEYSIKEPIRATTKSGVPIKATSTFNPRNAFRVDKNTGKIFINETLNHDLAAVVMLTVQARDVNAAFNKDLQVATADVAIYIQSFKDTNPIFKNKGWSGIKPVINVKVHEEMPIGSTLFTLKAEDPVSSRPINSYQMLEPEKSEFFDLNDRTGEIILSKRIDYEALDKNIFEFQVKAFSNDGRRSTLSLVNITVENVNDNTPEFDQVEYKATIVENQQYPEIVLTVKAADHDAVLTDLDKKLGYNKVTYSLSGEHSNWFTIDNMTGVIKIAPNQVVDREKSSLLRLIVKAEDAPGRPNEARAATADLFIEVLDVNDNPPEFTQKSFTTVIPENLPVNSFVIKITATDPDEGPGGEIRYEFLNEGELNGLLKIKTLSGEIETKMPLTGKGRAEPYELVIRAQDNGGIVPKQKSLHSDTTLVLFIGDVSSNDGVPFFILPKVGQVASVSENATVGSPVFQVVAGDPDNPASPAGTLTYKIQEDIGDSMAFRIDSISGLITTKIPLDREKKENYSVILEVSDNGEPRQSVTRILKINVLDIDDHKPRFARDVDDPPIEMTLKEEQPMGTFVGNVTAIDEDIDENGAIDYMFIDGNQENIFRITRTEDNKAYIETRKPVDRERVESILLTVKCFKYGIEPKEISRNVYNKNDPSEVRILIKIEDVDDHLPRFKDRNPTLGVRINVPIDTSITTVEATDEDPEALPINYVFKNVTFIPQFYKRSNMTTKPVDKLFNLNNRTGEIRTAASLSDFVDGYFEVIIIANNSENVRRNATNKLKIYVIRDKSLMRFLFTKPATEIRSVIHEFQQKIQSQLRPMNLELHIFDTQVLTKSDLSLDFSATSSCFQLFRGGSAMPLHDMEKVMKRENVEKALSSIYSQYGVSQVESCTSRRKVAAASIMSSVGTWLVILAALIGMAAVAATCTAFCIGKRQRSESKQLLAPRVPPEPYGAGAPVFYSEPIYGPL